MGWLTGYTYRKKGAVNATAAGAQTNYQMKLLVGESSGASGEEVDCGNNCQDFPNDVRFTGADGVTKHDYWVESTIGTTPNRLATIWVEVAAIPATGSVDLYMYYSKSGDGGASSGTNTFVDYNMSGIVALWHMDEASWGGTPDEVEDETGINDGVSGGGADTVAGGKRNRCGYFDGSGYIDCGNDNTLRVTTTFSLVGWIKPAAIGSSEMIVTKYEPTNNVRDYVFKTLTGGEIRLYVTSSDAANYDSVKSTNALSADTWHHFVATFDNGESGILNKIKLYLDGSLETGVRDEYGGTFTGIEGTTADVVIGAYNSPSPVGFFTGNLDEVSIFNRVLSSTEAAALHANHLQKMGAYYNIRKWASPEPTWGAWGSQSTVGTRCYAFIIG